MNLSASRSRNINSRLLARNRKRDQYSGASQSKSKDAWDKLDVLLKPAGSLLAAAVAAYLGFLASDYIQRQQRLTASLQLYAQLMSSREASDSALRKEMFNTTLTAFLSSPTSSPEERISRLELLSHNFHDSLDIASLFEHVDRQLDKEVPARQELLRGRLEHLAKRVNRQQLAVLEAVGAKSDRTIRLTDLSSEAVIPLFQSIELRIPNDPAPRTFSVEVFGADTVDRTLRFRLLSRTKSKHSNAVEVDSGLEVGIFDFPMVRNVRLPGGNRCALVITQMTKTSAEVTLVYFPGSRASLKEKPYYDEVLEQLLVTPKTHQENS